MLTVFLCFEPIKFVRCNVELKQLRLPCRKNDQKSFFHHVWRFDRQKQNVLHCFLDLEFDEQELLFGFSVASPDLEQVVLAGGNECFGMRQVANELDRAPVQGQSRVDLPRLLCVQQHNVAFALPDRDELLELTAVAQSSNQMDHVLAVVDTISVHRWNVPLLQRVEYSHESDLVVDYLLVLRVHDLSRLNHPLEQTRLLVASVCADHTVGE